MPVTLVRHTTPAAAAGLCYGSTDLALADSFVDEAAAVLQGLPDCDRVVSSPLQRCRALAESIASHFVLSLAIDERLREMDFGRWEGRLWHDIPRPEVNAWSNDFLHARPHGGESVAMLRARSLAALGEWRHAAGNTVIVTHSGVIKAMLATGDTAADFDTQVDFGGIVKLNE